MNRCVGPSDVVEPYNPDDGGGRYEAPVVVRHADGRIGPVELAHKKGRFPNRNRPFRLATRYLPHNRLPVKSSSRLVRCLRFCERVWYVYSDCGYYPGSHDSGASC